MLLSGNKGLLSKPYKQMGLRHL